VGARSRVSEEVSFFLFPPLKKPSAYYVLVLHFIGDSALPTSSRFNLRRSSRISAVGLFFFYRLKKPRVRKEGKWPMVTNWPRQCGNGTPGLSASKAHGHQQCVALPLEHFPLLGLLGTSSLTREENIPTVQTVVNLS